MDLPLSGNPALADAAHVFSDQLRVQLEHFASIVAPQSAALDRKFKLQLRQFRFERRAAAALAEITFGAASRLLAAGGTPAQFFDAVSRAGRRLAKLNVTPQTVLRALESYDALLEAAAGDLEEGARANAHWVRDQLHFCVVLSLNNAYYQVRETEMQAFQQVMAVELESYDLTDIYTRFIQTMAAMCHAHAAALYLLDPADTRVVVAAGTTAGSPVATRVKPAARKQLARPLQVHGGRPSGLCLDPAWAGLYPSIWSVPLGRNGDCGGIAQFGFKELNDWLPRDVELFEAAAERCQLAVERARLVQSLAAREAQLKELAEHMLHVEEMERRRISRELHDEAGQSLVCIRLQLELTEGDVPDELERVRQSLHEVRDLTEKTILDIRRLIADLSPAVLEQLGLGAAVRQLVNRFRKSYPCSVRMYVGKLTAIPQKVQIVTYRLLQECCNNIAKHSSATNVNISVTSADGVLKLNVTDNGIGFDLTEALAKHKSFGLSGMRERVALLGGRFNVTSEPAHGRNRGKGTEIQIELPLPAVENSLNT